jgi:hypothetical protein
MKYKYMTDEDILYARAHGFVKEEARAIWVSSGEIIEEALRRIMIGKCRCCDDK